LQFVRFFFKNQPLRDEIQHFMDWYHQQARANAVIDVGPGGPIMQHRDNVLRLMEAELSPQGFRRLPFWRPRH
jgi:hypothetical protein